MGIAYNTSIVRSGLVLHLDAANVKSYPGSGTSANDLSSNSNTATLNNGVSVTSNSFLFDGVDDYISCNHSASLDIRREITLDVWFKLNALNFASGWSNIVSKMDFNGNTSTRTYSAFINSTGYIHLCSADTSGQETFNSTSFITTNVWYHWCGVIDRNTGTVRQYVNGSSNQTGTIRKTDTISNTEPVCLNIRGGYTKYSGYTSAVKIYSRALSAAEVKQNFEATRGRYGI